MSSTAIWSRWVGCGDDTEDTGDIGPPLTLPLSEITSKFDSVHVITHSTPDVSVVICSTQGSGVWHYVY